MRAQVLGLFGDVVNNIGNAFSGIANWFSDRIGQYIDYFISIILKFVYEILKVFFTIIDFIQVLFRKIAGLETVRYNGEEISGDIAWWLFQQEAVTDALISLVIVAVVMVFMATFIAIIRNNYKAKEAKETAVGPVIGQAFKALFSFIFVPIVCYFGVFISNGLLKTVDQATRISDALSISGEVFASSAMSANRARTDADFKSELLGNKELNFGIFLDDNENTLTGKTAAEKIDRAFQIKQDLPKEYTTKIKNITTPEGNVIPTTETAGYTMEISDSTAGCDFMFNQPVPTFTNFDFRNTDLVFVYYDLTKFNWLFAFVSCFFVTTTLLYAAMGVVQRLFELTLLFAVSPPFIALMPLDGGNAFKQWAKKFIQSTIIMYGTVVALNFFFIVAPLLQQIDLFYSAEEIATYGQLTCDLFNGFAHILFIMCGALMIKDFTGILDQLVTGDGKPTSLGDMGKGIGGATLGTAGAIAGKANQAHKAFSNHFSPENVAKRKEEKEKAKAQKLQMKEQKSANKAVAKGMYQSGQVSKLGARRLRKEMEARDAGKSGSLKTRASEKLFGENKNLTDATDKFRQQRDAQTPTFAQADVNKSQKGLLSRVGESAGNLGSNIKNIGNKDENWKPLTSKGSAMAKATREVVDRNKTPEKSAFEQKKAELNKAKKDRQAGIEAIAKYRNKKLGENKFVAHINASNKFKTTRPLTKAQSEFDKAEKDYKESINRTIRRSK